MTIDVDDIAYAYSSQWKVRGKIKFQKTFKGVVLGSAKSNKNVNQHISGKKL